MEMIFTTFHILGKSNQEADVLSRLSTSGDYEIREKVLKVALRILNFNLTIDTFANLLDIGRRRIQTELEKRDFSLADINYAKSQRIEQATQISKAS
ncbi:MAG: hypothetical protein EZS28_040947 [Streblomastix strix]|uniref:Uncharacterized protein n=1 Tax=Streblomastix strix TaxID=222440 RepID=A0A5J4TZ16_9EUKA|nr:MAG: hypothetical protein EZS28_040947 [Streblomastix strix]